MPFRLALPRDLHDAILAQAQAEQPHECCGLLAGVVSDGVARVVERLPLVNELASERRYHAEGTSLFAAHRRMREPGPGRGGGVSLAPDVAGGALAAPTWRSGSTARRRRASS
ncbi:MAG: Mov34/MPN/PAD-1 family protein [Gemmataceae bacterium]